MAGVADDLATQSRAISAMTGTMISTSLNALGVVSGAISVNKDINTIANWNNNTTTTAEIIDVGITAFDALSLTGSTAALVLGTAVCRDCA